MARSFRTVQEFRVDYHADNRRAADAIAKAMQIAAGDAIERSVQTEVQPRINLSEFIVQERHAGKTGPPFRQSSIERARSTRRVRVVTTVRVLGDFLVGAILIWISALMFTRGELGFAAVSVLTLLLWYRDLLIRDIEIRVHEKQREDDDSS